MTQSDRASTRKLLSLYLAWAIVFGLAFGAGGYTMGYLVDVESLGNGNSPNSLQAAGNFGIENTGNSGTDVETDVGPIANTDEDSDENQPPSASFTYDRKGQGKSTNVDLDASGSSDPDGTIVSFEWYIGNDGGSTPDATGETVNSVKIAVGEVVKLVVTDDDGATDSESRTVED